MTKKKCTKCKNFKRLDEFHVDKGQASGLNPRCKECKKADNIISYWTNPEKGRAYSVNWRSANRERSRSNVKNWRITHPENFAKLAKTNTKRMRVNHPDEHHARDAVNNAVKHGDLPPAKTRKCYECGGPARQYHHHRGYAKEHWLDVVPVCIPCHRVLG